jgi:hypothetical protein
LSSWPSKGYSNIETDRKIEIVIAYRNNTEKAVAGVKGTVDVHDLFGDELSGFAISNEATIRAGRNDYLDGWSFRTLRDEFQQRRKTRRP